MSDALKKLTPGEKLGTGEGPFNAAFHNGAVDAIIDHQRRAAPLGSRAGMQSDRDESVFVANYAGTALAQYGIVGIGAVLGHPNAEDGEDTWPEQTLHKTAAPAAASPFGILLEPMANDTSNIAPIIVSGPAKCKILLTNTAHTFAAPGAANYTHLVSQSTQGPAKITWRQGSVGTQLNGAIDDTQLTGDVDSGDDFPEAPFVVTIGTEDLTVTAVSDDGLTWTWTRGANSTTPASHADNAAVAFKSGTVWASVLLLGTAPVAATITVDDADASDITYDSGTGVMNVPNAGVNQRGAVNTTTQTIMGVKTLVETDGATFNTASVKLGNEATNYGGTGYGTLMFSTAGEGTISLGGGGLEGIFTMAAVVTDDNGGSAYTPSVAFLNLLPRQSVSGGLASTRTLALLTGRYSTTTDFDTVESQPCYAVTSAVGNRHIGQWDTIAGLSFSGGLLTGGTLSLSGVSITGVTGTLDGGTW